MDLVFELSVVLLAGVVEFPFELSVVLVLSSELLDGEVGEPSVGVVSVVSVVFVVSVVLLSV